MFEAIFGLAVILAVLAIWLTGHWLGRALFFIVLSAAPVGFFLAYALYGASPNVLGSVVICLALVGAAWVVASLPRYYWEWRLERFKVTAVARSQEVSASYWE